MTDLGSIHSLDVGFDTRAVAIPVNLELRPGVEYRLKHADGIFTGNADELCAALVSMGYKVVAAHTPNGREIRAVPGGFEVQPHNDNYWIKCRTLAEAFTAYG